MTDQTSNSNQKTNDLICESQTSADGSVISEQEKLIASVIDDQICSCLQNGDEGNLTKNYCKQSKEQMHD